VQPRTAWTTRARRVDSLNILSIIELSKQRGVYLALLWRAPHLWPDINTTVYQTLDSVEGAIVQWLVVVFREALTAFQRKSLTSSVFHWDRAHSASCLEELGANRVGLASRLHTKCTRQILEDLMTRSLTELDRNVKIVNDRVVRVYGYTVDDESPVGIVMELMQTSLKLRFLGSATVPVGLVSALSHEAQCSYPMSRKASRCYTKKKSAISISTAITLCWMMKGGLKIADFGLSLLSRPNEAEEDAPPLNGRENSGTPSHMAPELFRTFFHGCLPRPSMCTHSPSLMWEVLTQLAAYSMRLCRR